MAEQEHAGCTHLSALRPACNLVCAVFVACDRLFCSDISGAAEPIRWALEQGGLEWTDKRLSKEEFGALKPSESKEKRTKGHRLSGGSEQLLFRHSSLRCSSSLCAWSFKHLAPIVQQP